MAESATFYTDREESPFLYNVVYIVNKTQVKLTTGFDSEFLARNFVNKLKRSKDCTLVSYPLFQY